MIFEEKKNGACVVEVGHYQKQKRRQQVCGDTFFSMRIREENRTISILSDGLGSGVKASVLSALTATMAARFTAGYRDIQKTAEIIMKTLPVCRQRKISYATFTVIDIDNTGNARIVEYDNPPCCIIRKGEQVTVEASNITGKIGKRRPYTLHYYTVALKENDRIVCFSDGVTQSGIGLPRFPLGWGGENAEKQLRHTIIGNPHISARELARTLVMHSIENDCGEAYDDISCGVVHFRKPREILIVTGPSFNRENDREMAQLFDMHQGTKIICGGTTSAIIARELGKYLRMQGEAHAVNIPPSAMMDGATMVTEGILTLQRVADILKDYHSGNTAVFDPAHRIVEYMLDSDIIRFLVGTRVNEAYQDPSLPQEIALRRSLIREIVHYLENIHLKETYIRYI